jgi:hypothetical protein
MFGDLKWCPTRINEQEAAFRKWQESLPKETRLVIVEVGAGKAIPRIRLAAEAATRDFPQATLIRINLDDSDVPDDWNAVSLGGMGAREALSKLEMWIMWRLLAWSKTRCRCSGFSSGKESQVG